MLALTACCVHHPPVVSIPPRDPVALLARLTERERQVRTLRARFGAEMWQGDASRRMQGVLVVQKPDRFRLRLFLPFGVTLFDYSSRGDHAWVYTPFEGNPDDFALLSRSDFAAAFLRGTHALPGACEAATETSGVVAVTCRSAQDARVLRILQLDPRRGNLQREVSYEQGAARMVIEYGDYRPAGGDERPFSILIYYPRANVSLKIQVQSYDVNPDLPDRLFEPAPASVSTR